MLKCYKKSFLCSKYSDELPKFFLNIIAIYILHTIKEKLVINSRTDKRDYTHKEIEKTNSLKS